MPSYLSLINFTDQGIRDVKDSMHRAGEFRAAVEAAGGSVQNVYWALGEADGAVIFDAPDQDIAASLLLHLARDGYVRTRTLQIFESSEFEKILTKI
jgi:uncharacterized protein with GYD domain